MTASEFIVLLWILLIFGSISAFFTYVAVRLILQKLAAWGFFVSARRES